MSVGQYRTGGFEPHRRPGRESFSLPQQSMLTAEQIEALRLSIGTLVTIAGTSDDDALTQTFTGAAVTLTAMLDTDAKAKAR